MPDRLRQKCGCHLSRHSAHNFAKPGIGLKRRGPIRDKPFREIRDIRKFGDLAFSKSFKDVGCRTQLVGGCETGAEVSLAKSEADLDIKLTCLNPFCQTRLKDLEKVARARLLIFMVYSRLVQDAGHKHKTIIGVLCASVGQRVGEFQNRFWILRKRRRPSIRPQQRSAWITCGWPIHKTSIYYLSHQCPQFLAASHRDKPLARARSQ
ncbi:MAG: hypothetical protein ABJO75_01375 [Sedimentitalea sp.]|uniref:hypothetical protein n=1 Tax=Sedimentitalea sp. TaxID=2048915 RepID=UPI0032989EA1